jgi:hypothetical protein
MNLTHTKGILPKKSALILSLVFLIVGTVNIYAGQENSEDLLVKIMDLHRQLVGNEVFLAQAKMLGAYLEAAQPLEETKKVKIYKTVLQILTKIKESPASIPPTPLKTKEEAKHKTFEAEQEGKSIFIPGAALLEIFKVDPQTKQIADLPVIRTYWNRDLSYSGAFLLPNRIQDVGEDSAYAAKFSFYYHAEKKGAYGFTVIHSHSKYSNVVSNYVKLTVGDVTLLKTEDETLAERTETIQGVCNLEKGFHRIEFLLAAKAGRSNGDAANFQVKILTPGAFDSVLLTKDMLLLKKE